MSDYQQCINYLNDGKKDDAFDIFSNADIEVKLDVIFTLLIRKKVIGEDWGENF